LGHPFDQVVDVIQSDFKFTKDSHISLCDICHKAKQTREPFPLSDHKTTVIGELVHNDLRGPYKVIRKDAFRYFMTIVDDYTRAVWIYLIKTKDEVYEVCDDNINNLNFFDEKHLDNQTSSLSPNDDGRVHVTPNDEGNVFPCTRTTQTSNVSKDTIATSMGEDTSLEGTVPSSSGLNAQNLLENICKVCKLNKSLYGLEQPLRQWNAKLTMDIFENGFVQSKFDYSLFTKKSNKVFIALLVYVDDIVITGNALVEIEKFKMFLKSKFKIKDLGKLKYFLGIEVLDNDDGIGLSQRNYCLELLHEYGLLAAKPVDTPLPENNTLKHVETKDDFLLDNIRNYQKFVGKLIYLTNTKPDISYVVHCLSQFMHAPLVSYLDDALRVLRYLKRSSGSDIQINRSGNLKLRAYADFD
nr:ribonuclease H-like domain-containing protein [Tanacetum cinerariifolium]